MRSVADDLKRADSEAMAASTPAERLALAFALGDRDLRLFAQSHSPPLSLDAARRELERRRQAARTPCACIEELIG